MRPSSAVLFLPSSLWLLFHGITLKAVALGATILALSVALDSWFYGHLTVVGWNFFRYNVINNVAALYGELSLSMHDMD